MRALPYSGKPAPMLDLPDLDVTAVSPNTPDTFPVAAMVPLEVRDIGFVSAARANTIVLIYY